MKPKLHHALCVFVLLLAASAHADDVTITIPVDVKSLMPEVASVAARCAIIDSTQKMLANYFWSGSGTLDGNGNYKGTLTAKWTGAPGVAVQAKSYKCNLALFHQDGTAAASLGQGSPPTDDVSKPKPGTPYVDLVTGPIK
jgi:hypothetical protein